MCGSGWGVKSSAGTHVGFVNPTSLCVLIKYGRMKKILVIKFKNFSYFLKIYTTCKPSYLSAGKGRNSRWQTALH